MKLISDLFYNESYGEYGLGDFYLPDQVSENTPLALAIHGGGAGLNKYSFSGVAAFLCELGFAVYNIHYRRGCFYCSEKVSSLKKVGDYRKLLTAPCCSEIISN